MYGFPKNIFYVLQGKSYTSDASSCDREGNQPSISSQFEFLQQTVLDMVDHHFSVINKQVERGFEGVQQQVNQSVVEGVKDMKLQVKECVDNGVDDMKKQVEESIDQGVEDMKKKVEEKVDHGVEDMKKKVEEKVDHGVKDMKKQVEKSVGHGVTDIKKQVEEKVDLGVEDMKKKVEESVGHGVTDIKKQVEEKVDHGVKDMKKKVEEKVEHGVEDMKKKVEESVGHGVEGMKKQVTEGQEQLFREVQMGLNPSELELKLNNKVLIETKDMFLENLTVDDDLLADFRTGNVLRQEQQEKCQQHCDSMSKLKLLLTYLDRNLQGDVCSMEQLADCLQNSYPALSYLLLQKHKELLCELGT
jgi:hypothetical protein